MDTLEQQLAAETSGKPDVLDAVKAIVEQMKTLKLNVAARAAIDWQDKSPSLAAAGTVVSGEETRLTELIARLQTSADAPSSPKGSRDRTGRIESEESGKYFPATNREQGIRSQMGYTGNNCQKQFNRRSTIINEAAKQASEELLNKDFGRRFEEECKRLRAPKVTLNFPGRPGQVTRRKLVASYNPTQILSEGEQKALAFADFLTEVTSVPAPSPVVFDDPITSMDYRRIPEVCERIVSLAEEHQIIVFTHDILSEAELLVIADKK